MQEPLISVRLTWQESQIKENDKFERSVWQDEQPDPHSMHTPSYPNFPETQLFVQVQVYGSKKFGGTHWQPIGVGEDEGGHGSVGMGVDWHVHCKRGQLKTHLPCKFGLI